MQMWCLISSPRASIAWGPAAESPKVLVEVGIPHPQKQPGNCQSKTLYANLISAHETVPLLGG